MGLTCSSLCNVPTTYKFFNDKNQKGVISTSTVMEKTASAEDTTTSIGETLVRKEARDDVEFVSKGIQMMKESSSSYEAISSGAGKVEVEEERDQVSELREEDQLSYPDLVAEKKNTAQVPTTVVDVVGQEDSISHNNDHHANVVVSKACERFLCDPPKEMRELYSDLPKRHFPAQPLSTPPPRPEEADLERRAGNVPSSSTTSPLLLTGDGGCYLVYENDSYGTMRLHFCHNAVSSTSGSVAEEPNAVGFFWVPWSPSFTRIGGCGSTDDDDDAIEIPEYKFTTYHGYWELIGGQHHGGGVGAGNKTSTTKHRKYMEGWCQFIHLAKHYNGRIMKFSNNKYHHPHIMAIDIYGYAKSKVWLLDLDEESSNNNNNKSADVSHLEAVAVVPHNNDRFIGVHSLAPAVFLGLGNLEGASLKLV